MWKKEMTKVKPGDTARVNCSVSKSDESMLFDITLERKQVKLKASAGKAETKAHEAFALKWSVNDNPDFYHQRKVGLLPALPQR
jgi:hypothetical protein